MFHHIIAFCVFGVFALPAWAACNGVDLRPDLTQSERAILAERINDAPFAEGNHWRATQDGKVLHLIGTMHLGDPRLDAPTDRLQPVVETADLLLLEMTAEDEAAMQSRLAADPSFLMLSDTSLPMLLDEPQWRALSAALADRGIPSFVAARFQPWYVTLLLALPPCLMSSALSEDGFDARLERIASNADVPRAALEDGETIFGIFADAPLDNQVEMMLSALVDDQVSEDMFATLLASYFEEKTAEGWAVSTLLAERYAPLDPETSRQILAQMEQSLLTQRNQAWIPVILAAVKQHDTVVAAFGAAHLPGNDGVLNLLAQEGFVLEQLPF